jgi:transposase
MLFVRAYPRETQEMVFDAHDRAFALFKGACGRGIYDNMKTAVETVFVGKDRLYNRRFLQMCSHYLQSEASGDSDHRALQSGRGAALPDIHRRFFEIAGQWCAGHRSALARDARRDVE